MSKFKLTKAGRAVVGVVLAVAVAVGVVGGIKGGVIKFDKKKPTASKPSTSISTDKPSNSAGDDTMGGMVELHHGKWGSHHSARLCI